MNRKYVVTILALLLPVMVNAKTNLGTFSSWSAWEDTDENGRYCYISSRPIKSQPTNVSREEVSFMVAHKKGGSKKNVPSTAIGYQFDASNPAKAVIDGQSFSLATDNNRAWLAKEGSNSAFVTAMKKGAKLKVMGRSTQGIQTTDYYSLRGVTAAMKEIDSVCN